MNGIDDATGFKKPPREHRFKKGQSGNPRGRPKGSQNASALLAKRLNKKVRLRIDGVPREMTTLQVILERLVNGALTGELPDVHKFIAMINKLMPDALDEAPAPPPSPQITFHNAPGSTVRLPPASLWGDTES